MAGQPKPVSEISLFSLGSRGVNTDLNPLQLADEQLTKAQNAISNPLGVEGGLTNRPGLIELNGSAAAGSVLGGIGVPLINLNTGTRYFYIGRGPTT